MKRIFLAMGACSIALGCSGVPGGEGDTGVADQDLDITEVGNLVKMQGATLAAKVDEAARETETDAYYQKVTVSATGTGTDTIKSRLSTLNNFISFYGFAQHDVVAKYYNRGDLGIGREMHCSDNFSSTGVLKGEIACYVKNFAAGDDGSEFTFGGSPDIAFSNLAKGHQFATVAMVFRNQAPAANKLFFVVYDNQGAAGGNLLKFAALDRGALLFQNAFVKQQSVAGLGTPGVNFNNQIPSNCVTCHGGTRYDGVAHTETGSLFLPFDLDQFEYDGVNTRAAQEAAFRNLNQIVRKVAVASGAADINSSLKNQIDGWYNNLSARSTTLSGNFNSDYVPAGWATTPATIAVYKNAVRGGCRNCHVVNDQKVFHFDDAATFTALAPTIAADLNGYVMPHSLQSIRTFWQSGQAVALETYFKGLGTSAGDSAATIIHNAGVGKNVTTLDPNLINAAAVR